MGVSSSNAQDESSASFKINFSPSDEPCKLLGGNLESVTLSRAMGSCEDTDVETILDCDITKGETCAFSPISMNVGDPLCLKFQMVGSQPSSSYFVKAGVNAGMVGVLEDLGTITVEDICSPDQPMKCQLPDTMGMVQGLIPEGSFDTVRSFISDDSSPEDATVCQLLGEQLKSRGLCPAANQSSFGGSIPIPALPNAGKLIMDNLPEVVLPFLDFAAPSLNLTLGSDGMDAFNCMMNLQFETSM